MLAERFGGGNKVINMSVSEIIPLTKLQKYINNDLFLNVGSKMNAVKTVLFMN